MAAKPIEKGGAFVVSLDFELYWGMRDVVELRAYEENLLGVWEAIPRMLNEFRSYEIHATWAAVGFVMMSGFDELARCTPGALPNYRNTRLCPYRYAASQRGAPLRAHFAPELVERILAADHQELGTHTLSHFYCLEEPTSLDAFSTDLEAALALSQTRFGVKPTSLVFPRNQTTPAHVERAAALGITSFRGNPRGWMYQPRAHAHETRARRGARLLDAYLPVSRDLSHGGERLGARAPFDVAASRFLAPISKRLRIAEPLRLRRIADEMEHAAKAGRIYHLWWHPHNFGVRLDDNIEMLRTILKIYERLATSYGMRSLNMGEVAARCTAAAV